MLLEATGLFFNPPLVGLSLLTLRRCPWSGGLTEGRHLGRNQRRIVRSQGSPRAAWPARFWENPGHIPVARLGFVQGGRSCPQSGGGKRKVLDLCCLLMRRRLSLEAERKKKRKPATGLNSLKSQGKWGCQAPDPQPSRLPVLDRFPGPVMTVTHSLV